MKLNLTKVKSLKLFLTSILFMFLLTSCAHKNIDGSNDFESLISNMVETSYKKVKSKLAKDEIILVSDFVNIDRLKNHSKLGFLLSETLKDSLSLKDIIIREVELSKSFKIGEHGFNILSRDNDEIHNQIIDANYAMVGTYSITRKRLIVFVKLIDIHNGHILSSSSTNVRIDEEILQLERAPKSQIIYAPTSL